MITVHVTKEHIKDGNPKNCGKCPIALALASHFPGYDMRVLNLVAVVVEKDTCDLVSYADLPLEARNFIARFDNRLEVFPFSFEINFKAVGED